ncbi:hypothetical protein BX600DRAFT_507424 [Xylariales sp. PMI_506]|nr:hypothetical protein BX600DRAFT_507424 [Xylariales sp. PMI_506]
MADTEPQQDQPPYDTKDEVVWFISVSKEPSWTQEKFIYEYQQVHASAVRLGHKHSNLPLHYDQIGARELSDVTKEFYPGWDFVTSLRWPSAFVIWAGFQNPMYQENAGKHIFCQLTQKGSIAKKVGELSYSTHSGDGVPVFSVLVFHHRLSADDEASELWIEQRLHKAKDFGSSRISKYIIYQDVTPKNTDDFFKGTQFDQGSWLLFKAVEQLLFSNQEEAAEFVEKNKSFVTDGSHVAPFITGGKIDIVIE